MNKKTAIVSVMLGVLLIGIVSAGLLEYFGRITATVEVEGPVFYAAPQEILLINEEPDTHSHTLKIIDGEKKIFWTFENLGGLNFNYIPKLTLFVRAKVNNILPSKPLTLSFGYSDSDNIRHEICNGIVYVDAELSSDFGEYSVSCEGNGTLSDVNEFYYDIIGEGDLTIEYKISTKNTKVEMDKAI
jgi:hypothetical protein